MTSSSTAEIPRGGGDSSEDENQKKPKEKEQTVEEIQEEALQNISNCYKVAFAGGIFGVASIWWELFDKSNSNNLAGSTGAAGLFLLQNNKLMPTKELIDLITNSLTFVFAFGLYQAYNLFRQSSKSAVDRMSPPNLLKLSKTLNGLWLGVLLSLQLDSIFSLGYYTIRPLLDAKHRWLFGVTTVGSFLLSLPLGGWFHRTSLQKEQQQSSSEVATEYEPARKVGLGACRSMIWCVGSLALGGMLEVMQFTLQTFQAASLEDKVGVVVEGLLEVSESVIMTGLLASLYRTLMRAILVSTKRNFNSKDPSFKEYYQAQTKFYGRVASWFGFQILFPILGGLAQWGEKWWFASRNAV